VGSALIRGQNDFTGDIVLTDGLPSAKVGPQLSAERAPRARRLSFSSVRPMSAGVELIVDFLSYVKDQLFTWLPLIFLGLLVYFFWRCSRSCRG
jgi:hypothetical protein